MAETKDEAGSWGSPPVIQELHFNLRLRIGNCFYNLFIG